MQDRYAGDIGDYGKIALLRQIQETGLTIGVNWYKVEPAYYEKAPDGSYKQADGKYCIPIKYRECDEELAAILLEICHSENNRSIKAIEDADLIAGAKYYDVPVSVEDRETWHKNALKKLKETKLIPVGRFGIEVKETKNSDWILVNTAGEIAAGSGGRPVMFNQRGGAERSNAYYNAEDKVLNGEWYDIRVVEGEDTGK